MCICKNPWITSAADVGRKIPDARIQTAVGVYDLLCNLCNEYPPKPR